MEVLLLGVDILFMLILVIGVVRRERKKNPASNLGFFSYLNTGPDKAEQRRGSKRA